jgi:hypothetical protein
VPFRLKVDVANGVGCPVLVRALFYNRHSLLRAAACNETLMHGPTPRCTAFVDRLFIPNKMQTSALKML